MQQPGRWLPLRKPIPRDLTRAAQNIKTNNEFKRFYYDHGTFYERVYCVAWSQDLSFYCCPRDYQCDPASGWNKTFEEIELFSRRKQDMYDDFYGYF